MSERRPPILTLLLERFASFVKGRMFSGPHMVFRLERPTDGELVSDAIVVQGWVFTNDSSPVIGSAFVTCNGRASRFPLNINVPRPDVQSAYALDDLHSTCGFAHRVEWPSLGEDVVQANISLELAHRGRSLSFGPYLVNRTSSPILRHRRGSYKDVWDEACDDEGSAMLAVAGSSDDSFWESGRTSAETIRIALDITKDDDVLEIGCGLGRIGLFLSDHCKSWTGGDISSKMIRRASAHLKNCPNAKLLTLGTGGLHEFADNSLDKVYCSTVLMHLDEWDRYRYIAEAFRVLRAGGKCYFDNVNLQGEEGWRIFHDMASVDPVQRPAAATKPSTPEELITYLRRVGFVEIVLRPGPHYVAVIGKKPTGDPQERLFKDVDTYPPGHVFKPH